MTGENPIRDVSRRGFLSLSGAGLFVFFSAEPAEAFQEPARLPSRQSYPKDVNAYLRIGADGRVTGFAGKVELGQGSTTALAQLLADELDVPFDSVDMIMGDTDLCPWDMGTFGSMNIRFFGPAMRAAAAEARGVLLEMAAERLEAPVERLLVKAGVVSDSAHPEKSVTYAQLVDGKRIERHLEKVSLKAATALQVVGQSPRRKDAMAKVTGRAKYAGDMVLPGMLYARMVRPSAHGAKLKSADTGAAEKMAGVRVVRDGDLIAVLHERPDVAEEALRMVKADFERPQSGPDDSTIFDHLLQTGPAPHPVAQTGNLADGEQLAQTVVKQKYLNSYVAHAPIETHAALANFEGGKLTVWASTQTPFMLQQAVARAIQLPQQNVRVISSYVGGGFGGKSGGDQAVEAARLARITGKPVQVMLNRAEEFFFDTFRPAAVAEVRAGATRDGKLTFWDAKVVGAGEREAKPFYAIPHMRVLSAGEWMGGNPPGMHPFGVGAWRAPSVNTNTFVRESLIDSLAAKLEIDPVEFRLKNLTDARMRRVLETAAAKFGWKSGRSPSARGWGVSCGVYSDTCVATIAEVAVDRKTGQVQVKRVVCVQDQGLTVSPDGSRQQMEGSITMGMGYALSEEVKFRNGEVLSRNFDSYEIPRYSWVPKIETVLIESTAPSSGCGEPAIINMGAVLANAIFDAVGARVLQLPMTPERVLAALRSA